MQRFFIILQILVFYIWFSSNVYADSTTSYLKKEVVDSTIMSGFFALTEAANSAGIGVRQKEAIEAAKRIAKSLRLKTKGDPNERYIMWKISELESQIYLEENDLLIKKKQQDQISVNEYIVKYNAEVGKSRPDFASMRNIHTEMSALDSRKADELADSFNKRCKAISREVLFSIEKALLAGDAKKAREELGYCLRNLNYLKISGVKFTQIENRVINLINACEQKLIIENQIDSAEISINKLKFCRGRLLLSSAQYKLQMISQYLPLNIGNRLAADISLKEKMITNKEDSLVKINLTILSMKGITAADGYLQKVLKPCGVAREKIAYVDSSIIVASSPSEKNAMAVEIESISQYDSTKNTVFKDIRENAKKKAQNKIDSIRLSDELAFRSLQEQKIVSDRINGTKYDEQKKVLQKNQEIASNLCMDIYSLLEQNQINDANNSFFKNQDFLRRYLSKEAYNIVETTVAQFAETADYQQVKYISPTQSLQLSNSQQSDYVKSISCKKSKTDDSNYKGTFDNNKKRAQQEIVDIYSMLERNEIQTAFNKFLSIRKPLQKFLSKEAFDILDATVVQAYKDSVNRKK